MSLNPPVSDEDVCFYLSGIHNATASSLLEQALGKNETKTELLSALGADDLTCEFPAPPNSDTGSNASLPVYIGAAVGGCLLLIGMIAAFLLIGRGKLSRSNRTASRINEKTLHQSLMHVPGEEEMSREEEEQEMDTMHWFSPPPPPSDTPFAPPTNPILPSMNVSCVLPTFSLRFYRLRGNNKACAFIKNNLYAFHCACHIFLFCLLSFITSI